jgi:hypothetical protein
LQWGTGGWLRARCNLVFGPYKSGKSSLVLKGAAAEQQKRKKSIVLVFDSEWNYTDPHEKDGNGKLTERAILFRTRLTKAGLNPDLVYVFSGNTVDTLFGHLEELEADVMSGKLDVCAIIVDSWGALQGEHAQKKIREGEVSVAGNQPGGNAKTINPLIQAFLRIAAEGGVTTFFVQHCIRDIETGMWSLLGGEKLRYLVHNILFVEAAFGKESYLLANGESSTKTTAAEDLMMIVGKKIRFRCEKSRNLVEGRKGEFWFNFDDLSFALPEVSLFNLAVGLSIIAHPILPVVDEDGNPELDDKGQPKTKEQVNKWEFPVGVPTPRQFTYTSGMLAGLKEDKDLYNAVYQACLKSDKKEASINVAEDDSAKAKRKKKD